MDGEGEEEEQGDGRMLEKNHECLRRDGQRAHLWRAEEEDETEEDEEEESKMQGVSQVPPYNQKGPLLYLLMRRYILMRRYMRRVESLIEGILFIEGLQSLSKVNEKFTNSTR